MITLVSSPKQHMRKDMQHSVCIKAKYEKSAIWKHCKFNLKHLEGISEDWYNDNSFINPPLTKQAGA